MSAPQLPGITPLPATLKAAANSALSRGWMDTGGEGEWTAAKTGCKGKRICFQNLFGLWPSESTLSPLHFECKHIFFDWVWVERLRVGCLGGGGRWGPVTIHILIIWRLHLLLRGRHDSFTIAGAVAFLQHAWPSCLNNTGSVLRHHTAVKYWLNTRVRPQLQESFLNRLFKII